MRITLSTGTPAELGQPDGPPLRGLVLLPDIYGLRPLFDNHVARLADQQRWAVCAPEPFPGREDTPTDERIELVASLNDADVLADARAAADALDLVEATPVGILGFCMGGMFALKASATGRFDKAVAFYAQIRLPEAWRGPGQGEPLDALAGGTACPVLAIVGERDPFTPAADIDALEATEVEVVRYPEADHGFVHDPDRPTFRADDAADAWTRAINFLS